jgi:hypothetical protein
MARRFFCWLGIGILAVATFAAIVFMTDVFAEDAYRFLSPDGRHQLIVYKPRWTSTRAKVKLSFDWPLPRQPVV